MDIFRLIKEGEELRERLREVDQRKLDLEEKLRELRGPKAQE